jgi:hypothetical protein
MNVEHYGRAIQEWTQGSVLCGLQEHFLHSLMHRDAPVRFNVAKQGSGTVQDLLNKLVKHVAQMVPGPDEYTFRKRFLTALRSYDVKSSYEASTPNSVMLLNCRLLQSRSKMLCAIT